METRIRKKNGTSLLPLQMCPFQHSIILRKGFFSPSAGDGCALWSHYQSQLTVNHTHKALDLTVDIKMSLLVTTFEGLQHGQTHLGHTKSHLYALPHTPCACLESLRGIRQKLYLNIRLCSA